MKSGQTFILCLIFAQSWLGSVSAVSLESSWPHWRGPADNGCAAEGDYPVKWDETNCLWKVPLPGKGCSTPIVWDGRIFLTAPVEGKDAAVAFDWKGKPVWQRVLGPETAGKRQNSSGCNPSPVTDGESVFVYFKSGTLAALDLSGNVRWQTNLVQAFGPEKLFWDQGTSPVLTPDCVVVARMHNGDSWVTAFNKDNGQIRWKTPRNYQTPVEGDNSYTTPLVIGDSAQQLVVVWGAEHLTAYTAENGKLAWSCGGFNPKAMGYWPTVASPVLAGEVVVVACGRADRGQPRLYGIKLGGTGDVSETHRAWMREDVGTFVPTPVVSQGRVYIVRDQGEVDCVDPLTGRPLWKEALPKSRSSYFSSPVIAAGRLYAARDDGVVFVAQVEPKFELLAQNPMGEQIIASPVPVQNHLLIRGDRHLFCIGAE